MGTPVIWGPPVRVSLQKWTSRSPNITSGLGTTQCNGDSCLNQLLPRIIHTVRACDAKLLESNSLNVAKLTISSRFGAQLLACRECQ